jgi:hypothetical protein
VSFLLFSSLLLVRFPPPPLPHDLRFSADHIGVFVVGGDVSGAETILRNGGAEEIRRVA